MQVKVLEDMFSYKTGIILLLNFPCLLENISPGACTMAHVQSQLAIMNLAIVNGKIVIGPLSCFPAMLLADLP